MMSLIISVFQKIPIVYVNRGNGWHNQAEGDDRQVLAVDLNAGKDGTVTALRWTTVPHRNKLGEKRVFVCINKRG